MDRTQGFGRKDGRMSPKAPTPTPRRHLLILGALLVTVICAAAVAWIVMQQRPASPATKSLATQDDLRRAAQGVATQSAALVQQYPEDPRLRLIHGVHLADARDLVGAEREYRIGLVKAATLGSRLPLKVEVGLRTALVSDLLLQGRHDDAKAAAKPLCGNQSSEPLVAKSVTMLRSHGMCE
jgi:hypothetical protein